MVLEVAIIDITPGRQDEFSTAYHDGRTVLAETAGCLSVRMTHGIERPDRFILLVEWESVQAHEDFRSSDRFAKWRGFVGPFFAGPPLVEHFADVD